MTIKKLTFLFISLFILSCGKNEIIDNYEKRDIYHDFSISLTNELNNLAQEMRKESLTFGSIAGVEKSAQKAYKNNPNELNYFLSNLKSSNLKKSAFESNNFHPEITSVVHEIELELANSSSQEEFTLFLDNKFESVFNSKLAINNKERLLLYITSYKVGIQFVVNNIDIIKERSNYSGARGWWTKWGKCAAGVLGGAGTGALTFGLGGAAVGTVTVPVLGTISAGLVGAVGGGIAGGLTGAAEYC